MNRGMEEKDNWKNQNFGFLKVEKNPWVILLIFLISIIGLFINGYNYDIIDHAIYIPMIDRAINPALFPNDYLFDEPSEGYNFWLPIMTFLARFFPLEWIFFVGYILVNFGFFWSIYHVSLIEKADPANLSFFSRSDPRFRLYFNTSC